MWEVFFQFTFKWMGYIGLMLLIVAVCWPVERWFPRITQKKTSVGRLTTITVLTLVTVVIVQAYSTWGQQAIIATFVKFKFFSLSKLSIPDWALILVSMMLLDFFYYLSHLISHYIPTIWRLHKIHHADEHVTAFSSLLHHPLESLYVALFVTGCVVMSGMPVLVLVYFGIALACHAVFSHADIALPETIDRSLRWFLVTPDVHRTHHSQNIAEGNSNFGAMFTIWDRLFGTYLDQPREPVSQLSMGLPADAKPAAFSARELLLFPFRR